MLRRASHSNFHQMATYHVSILIVRYGQPFPIRQSANQHDVFVLYRCKTQREVLPTENQE